MTTHDTLNVKKNIKYMTINFLVLRHQYLLYSVAAAAKRDLQRRQKSQNQGMTHFYMYVLHSHCSAQ